MPGSAASTPLIRDAVPADAAAIAAIYNQSIAAGDTCLDLRIAVAQGIAARLAALPEREAWLVLERAGSVLGYGQLFPYSPRLGYRATGETAVYLDRACCRQGWGTQLKHALITRARALDYHHLVAKVLARNSASLAYNLKLGYELVGTQREVGWLGGRWEDVCLLQLLLDDPS